MALSDVAPFALIPTRPAIDPDVALAAATLEAQREFAEGEEVEGRPFGRSWLFDFERGQFLRPGADPTRAIGLDSLKMWVLNTLYTERFGSPIHDDDFGVELLDAAIGRQLTAEVTSAVSSTIREALVIHDRIVEVEDFEFASDADDDVLLVSFTVVLDSQDRVAFGNVGLPDA